MPTKLTNIRVVEGSLVDKGANQDARVMLFKRDEVGDGGDKTPVIENENVGNHPDQGFIKRLLGAIGKALGWSDDQEKQAQETIAKEYDDMPHTTAEVMEHRKAMEEFSILRSAFMSSLNSIMENSNHPDHANMLQRSVKEFSDAAAPIIGKMRMGDMRKAEEMLEDLDAATGGVQDVYEVIKAFAPPEGYDKSPVNQPPKESEGERSMKLADVLKAVGIDLDKQVEGQPSGDGTNTAVNKSDEEIKKQFADLQKQADEAKAQVAELKKAAEDADVRAKAAEAVAKAEQEKRVTREYLEKAAQYTHMGAVDEVAARLRKAYDLDEEFGKQLEADFAKANAAIETSKLFDEAGRVGVVKEGSADAKLEALAKSLVAKDANMTYEQAFDKAMQTPEGARLYEESLREKGVN